MSNIKRNKVLFSAQTPENSMVSKIIHICFLKFMSYKNRKLSMYTKLPWGKYLKSLISWKFRQTVLYFFISVLTFRKNDHFYSYFLQVFND